MQNNSAETNLKPSSLILYHRDLCLFCWRVQHAISKLGIDVETRNIWEDTQYERELIEACGSSTVPVLCIVDKNGKSTWMPESGDIIKYLNHTYAR